MWLCGIFDENKGHLRGFVGYLMKTRDICVALPDI